MSQLTHQLLKNNAVVQLIKQLEQFRQPRMVSSTNISLDLRNHVLTSSPLLILLIARQLTFSLHDKYLNEAYACLQFSPDFFTFQTRGPLGAFIACLTMTCPNKHSC